MFILWGYSMEHAVAMEVIDKHLEANGVDDRARRQRLLVDPRILTRDQQSGNYRYVHVLKKFSICTYTHDAFNFFNSLPLVCFFQRPPSKNFDHIMNISEKGLYLHKLKVATKRDGTLGVLRE